MAECLGNYLADTQDAWVLQPDGRYKSVAITPTGKAGGKRGVSAQSTLMKLYAAP
jgi:hypothetical protein